MTANPSNNPPNPPSDLLDLYLDGLLQGVELRAFEALIDSDPEIRRAVMNHRRVDDGLKRVFKAPPISITLPVDPPAPIPISAASRKPAFLVPGRYLAYAALVLLAVGVGWWQMNASPVKIQKVTLSAGHVYKNLTSKGFEPEFVCTTDEKFNETMTNRFGQGLLIASAPNIELIGWAYADGYQGSVVSGKELILMAKVDGRETIVIMDNAKNAPWFGIKEEAPAGMRVFKRRVGDIVMYELTAADSPVLSDRAYIPGK